MQIGPPPTNPPNLLKRPPAEYQKVLRIFNAITIPG
jgi:hypothetical protein